MQSSYYVSFNLYLCDSITETLIKIKLSYWFIKVSVLMFVEIAKDILSARDECSQFKKEKKSTF